MEIVLSQIMKKLFTIEGAIKGVYPFFN